MSALNTQKSQTEKSTLCLCPQRDHDTDTKQEQGQSATSAKKYGMWGNRGWGFLKKR